MATPKNKKRAAGDPAIAFVPPDPATLWALISGGIAVGKDALETAGLAKGLAGKVEPLVIYVLDSTTDASKCSISIRAQNYTLNGIYIESLAITEPEDIELNFYSVGSGIGDTFSSGNDHSLRLPKLVKPMSDTSIKISFLRKAVEDRIKKPYVKIECIYSELTAEKTAHHRFDARIRDFAQGR